MWVTNDTTGSPLNDNYRCSECGRKLKMTYTEIRGRQEAGYLLFCDR